MSAIPCMPVETIYPRDPEAGFRTLILARKEKTHGSRLIEVETAIVQVLIDGVYVGDDEHHGWTLYRVSESGHRTVIDSDLEHGTFEGAMADAKVAIKYAGYGE